MSVKPNFTCHFERETVLSVGACHGLTTVHVAQVLFTAVPDLQRFHLDEYAGDEEYICICTPGFELPDEIKGLMRSVVPHPESLAFLA
jgi:hypothetical protein